MTGEAHYEDGPVPRFDREKARGLLRRDWRDIPHDQREDALLDALAECYQDPDS